jgi:hypothetical protein
MSEQSKKAVDDIKQDMLFEKSDKSLSEKLKRVSQSADEVEKHIEKRSE